MQQDVVYLLEELVRHRRVVAKVELKICFRNSVVENKNIL